MSNAAILKINLFKFLILFDLYRKNNVNEIQQSRMKSFCRPTGTENIYFVILHHQVREFIKRKFDKLDC